MSLLAEHEVTKLVAMVSHISKHLGLEHSGDVEELKRNVAPEAVRDAIETSERSAEAAAERADR